MIDKISVAIVAAMLSAVLAFFVILAILLKPAEGQNLCGNSCLSSADCMEGCVCMDDEGDGLGVCVSFN